MGDMRNIYIRVQNWQIADTLRIKALDALAVLHGEHSDSIKIEYYPEKINVLRSAVYAVKILTWSVFIVILLMAQQGILAMMLVSVHERTYEIGLRRSVGASSRDIIGQFLFEAVSIGFSGAALGIILAPISVFFISTMMEVHPDFHRFAVGCVIGLVLGLFAGILAGVKPAVKASRIDIVEAMRFE
jgi:putative ABC transport system permease protein